MKALRFERSIPRYAAARLAGALAPGAGGRVGPISLTEIDEPPLLGADWVRVRPRLSGICGSDLSTIDGRSSRYFEPIVSFPFVPGHEVVGELDDGARVVIEPVLSCRPRGISPPCPACASGQTGDCQRVAFGHLKPGLQTGYCSDTGGGWSTALIAHRSQLHSVPSDFDDPAAVMVEPTACAVHAAVRAKVGEGDTVAVIGAGTLGLTTIAALRRFALPGTLIASAKYPEQRRLAWELGADVVVEPGELPRAVRRATGTFEVGDVLAGGADVTVDCVGSVDSVGEALAITRPRGRVVLVGMPGKVRLDLTPLWHKEIELVGTYAYGQEDVPGHERPVRTFDLSFDLVRQVDLGRLVSAAYPLDRYREAIEHAASAGSRGAVKIVFDLRGEKRR